MEQIINSVLQRVEQLEQVYLNNKTVLNFEEASKFLSFSKSYLYKLTHKGIVPHYKPNGKNIYFNRLELEEWLQSNKVLSQEEIASKATIFLTSKRQNFGGLNNG